MAGQSRESVRISGAGTASGGSYEELVVSGSGVVTGDVEARRISISGAAKLAGRVKAETVRSSGSLRIGGDVEAGELRVSGGAKVGGGVHAARVVSSGSLRVEGSVSGGEVEVHGSGTFGGDVEVEQFRARGRFTVGGLLNADHMEVALHDEARAREIGGGEIRVLAATGRLVRWLRRTEAALHVESVEGDDVYLEGTHAEVVRGRRVVLGPGCVVAEVAYTESLQQDPEARVERRTYTGAEPSAPDPRVAPAARPEGWARDQVGGTRAWFTANVGQREVRNPVVAALLGAFGILVAALVVGLVITVVLPAVGFVVAIILGAVAVVLLLLAVGLPVVLLGALLFRRSRHQQPRSSE